MHPSKSNNAFTVRKLPARYARIVMPLILSCFMTFIVSFISTLIGVGWTDDVLSLWMGSWAVSWLIAFPAVLIMLPLARRLTSRIVQSAS